MKIFMIFTTIICIFLSGCSKKNSPKTPPKCDDTEVLQMLKDDLVQTWEPFCDGSDDNKYCKVKSGVFANIQTTKTDNIETKCYTEFSFGEYTYFIDYLAKYENGKLVVEKE